MWKSPAEIQASIPLCRKCGQGIVKGKPCGRCKALTPDPLAQQRFRDGQLLTGNMARVEVPK